MKYKIINTDITLNGKIIKENSVIELSEAEYDKEKKYFGDYLVPFFDDTNTESIVNHKQKKIIKKKKV